MPSLLIHLKGDVSIFGLSLLPIVSLKLRLTPMTRERQWDDPATWRLFLSPSSHDHSSSLQ